MNIRLMKIGDYKQVVAVWKAAGLNLDPIGDSEEAVARLLQLNPSSCFVACMGTKITGAVLGAFNGKRLWIYHLGVLPKFQGQGVGTALVEAVEMAAKQLKAPKICLGVGLSNLRVMPFYLEAGYVAEGDAIWMSKVVLK